MSSIVKFERTEDPFEHIDRAVLQDENLSIEALGSLCRLLSLPGNWEWRCWHLEKEVLKIGRDKRRRIFKEFENAGYLKKELKPNGKNGGWEHIYYLFRTPRKTDQTTVDVKPVDGFPGDGEGVYNTNNTELENTYSENTQLQPAESDIAAKPGSQDFVGSSGKLIFDKSIHKDLLPSIIKHLAKVPFIVAQQMVDVLSENVTKNNIKKNEISFLISLVKAYESGSFDPATGFTVARKRERIRAEMEERRLKSERKITPRNFAAYDKHKNYRKKAGI